MPTYDYHCETNGRTVEVFHPISTAIDSWGALCKLAEIDPGDTSSDTPVERLLGAGLVGRSSSTASSPQPQPGNPGPCARPGGCGCHPG